MIYPVVQRTLHRGQAYSKLWQNCSKHNPNYSMLPSLCSFSQSDHDHVIQEQGVYPIIVMIRNGGSICIYSQLSQFENVIIRIHNGIQFLKQPIVQKSYHDQASSCLHFVEFALMLPKVYLRIRWPWFPWKKIPERANPIQRVIKGSQKTTK